MGANADAKLSIYVTFLRIDRFLAQLFTVLIRFLYHFLSINCVNDPDRGVDAIATQGDAASIAANTHSIRN
jgi:hypothetical protein